MYSVIIIIITILLLFEFFSSRNKYLLEKIETYFFSMNKYRITMWGSLKSMILEVVNNKMIN